MSDLFSNTPYQPGSATSKASAQHLDESGQSQTQAEYILSALRVADDGYTVDELTGMMKCDGFPTIHNGTVAGRMVHLEQQFKVKKTNRTRKSSSGQMVTIYMIHDGTPLELPNNQRAANRELIEMAANFLGTLGITKQLTNQAAINRAIELSTELKKMLNKP